MMHIYKLQFKNSDLVEIICGETKYDAFNNYQKERQKRGFRPLGRKHFILSIIK